jgi:predicted Zn-dependent protease
VSMARKIAAVAEAAGVVCTLLKLNLYRRAVGELLIAAKQAPRMPAIQFALAKAYEADGQTTKALQAARLKSLLDQRG